MEGGTTCKKIKIHASTFLANYPNMSLKIKLDIYFPPFSADTHPFNRPSKRPRSQKVHKN